MDNPTETSQQPSQIQPTSAAGSPVVRELRSRVHLVIALMAGLALIAVPLVLWLGPPAGGSGIESTAASASVMASAASSTTPQDAREEFVANVAAKSAGSEKVELGKVWISKCQKPGPEKTAPEMCDRQPWFEQALVRSILENTACAPEHEVGGTVSVAMTVDYRRREVKVFAGKSGSIRGRSAQGLIKCVKRSIPQPDWSALEHEHTKYVIAVTATYRGH